MVKRKIYFTEFFIILPFFDYYQAIAFIQIEIYKY